MKLRQPGIRIWISP